MENLPNIISQTIDVLAEKFGSTGQHLFAILTKQVYVEAWTNLFIVGILFLVIIPACFGIKWARKSAKKNVDRYKYCDEGESIAMALSYLTVILCITFIIVCSINSFKKFSNPEYYALTSIQDLIHPKTP